MLPKQVQVGMDNATTKLNPDLAKGLAVKHLPQMPRFIDEVFRSVAGGFPNELSYLGCRRCTPQEEFREISKHRQSRQTYDVARSDVYMMEYRLLYRDTRMKDQGLPPIEKPISRFIHLPFVNTAGTIFLSGSRFVISPVLADRVISVGLNSIFVRLLKAKLTFNRVSHHYIANNETENLHVIWSTIYNKKKMPNSPKATVRANCSLVHYLLCKRGFTGMFKEYANITPIIGTNEITHDLYPKEEYVICSSSQLKPKGNLDAVYVPTDIRIAIKKNEYTDDVKNLIVGFFYIADMFPHRVKVEFVEHTRLWEVLLGQIIWSGNVGEGKLLVDVNAHIVSLDEYVDTVLAERLREIGYPSRDIYHLFYQILQNFNEWLLQADDKVSTMYEKELAVLQFVSSELISGINKLYFDLNAARRAELTEKKMQALMTTNLRQGGVYSLTRSLGSVTTTSASGDNMALKITNIVTPQDRSSKQMPKGRTNLQDPSRRLHASIAEVGSAWALPKSAPDGRSRLNLTLATTPSGLVVRNPKYARLLDEVQEKIKPSNRFAEFERTLEEDEDGLGELIGSED